MDNSNSFETKIIEQINCLLKNKQLHLEFDTPLISNGLLDSMAILALIEFAEKTFGIVFSQDDFIPDNFETARALGALIREKL